MKLSSSVIYQRSYGAVFILRTMFSCISEEEQKHPNCAGLLYQCLLSYWIITPCLPSYWFITLHLQFTLLYCACSISTCLSLQSTLLHQNQNIREEKERYYAITNHIFASVCDRNILSMSNLMDIFSSTS